jgi:CRP-like cAMP-binding protein
MKKKNLEIEYKVPDKNDERKTLVFKEFIRNIDEVKVIVSEAVQAKTQARPGATLLAARESQSSLSAVNVTKLLERSISVDNKQNGNESDLDPSLSLAPTDDDWNLILEGTKSLKYSKETYVIRQGQLRQQQILQIAKGSCRIEKELESGETIVLGTMTTADPIFGELSFLDGPGGRATASVVAVEDTTVHVIEGYFLDLLFRYHDGMSARFYNYLAQVLVTRLRLRMQPSPSEDDEPGLGSSSKTNRIARMKSLKIQKASRSLKRSETAPKEGKEGEDDVLLSVERENPTLTTTAGSEKKDKRRRETNKQ